MDQIEILNRVKDVIKDATMLDICELDHEKDLTGELDSLDTVEIIMGLEDEFKLEILDEDWEDAFQGKPLTVNTVVEFIKNKLG